MSLQSIAQRIEAAINAGDEFREAVDEAYQYLQSQGVTTPVHVGVSANYVIVFLPLAGPLTDPRDRVFLSKPIG